MYSMNYIVYVRHEIDKTLEKNNNIGLIIVNQHSKK